MLFGGESRMQSILQLDTYPKPSGLINLFLTAGGLNTNPTPAWVYCSIGPPVVLGIHYLADRINGDNQYCQALNEFMASSKTGIGLTKSPIPPVGRPK